MPELIFIRHGQTAGNLRHNYVGRTDEPLCPEGIANLSCDGLANLQPHAALQANGGLDLSTAAA